jgi:hypothetical protein
MKADIINKFIGNRKDIGISIFLKRVKILLLPLSLFEKL